MSRLAKKPITLPKGVEVRVDGETVHVKGPKGSLSFSLHKGIKIKVDGSSVLVEKDESTESPRALQGLMWAHINNMIVGVSKGFEKKLSMVGVGYRAAVQGQLLDLQVGNSHPTQVKIPKEVQVSVDKSVTIIITGIDKQAVGQFASTVRSKKRPEPYKGKGIRYTDEFVRKKAGKAAKAKTAGG